MSSTYQPQVRAPLSADHATSAVSGATHAYHILHVGFIILPLVAGIDKFLGILANWDQYLAPSISVALHTPAHTIMMVVGGIEILAAIVVAFFPRVGAAIVALWLLGIMANLVIHPGHYWDIAARDFGLFLAALALYNLGTWAHREDRPRATRPDMARP